MIAVSGALRSADFAPVDRLVHEALDRGRHHIVLDLHQVSRIEPEALGLLWSALRRVRHCGGALAAARAQPALHPALAALGSGGLTLYGTVSAALLGIHDADARP